jgi:hypothetical protein
MTMSYEYEATYLDSDSDSEAWPSDYEAFGDFESEGIYDTYDSADSYGEARGKRPARPRPVRTPKGGRLAPRRPAGGASRYVTQAAFAAAMAKVQQNTTATNKAIQTVDGRVRTVISDTQKLQAQTRKSLDKLRSDLRTTQTLSALIPLLAPPSSRFHKIAPLAHLVIGNEGFPGGQSSGQSGSAGPLGNTNNLITVGALAFASGIFDR